MWAQQGLPKALKYWILQGVSGLFQKSPKELCSILGLSLLGMAYLSQDFALLTLDTMAFMAQC